MKVQELLDSPEKWCQGCLAEDDFGLPLNYFSFYIHMRDHIHINKFCLIGAICYCYPITAQEVIAEIVTKHLNLKGGWLSRWNDRPGRTFTEVRKVIEELDI